MGRKKFAQILIEYIVKISKLFFLTEFTIFLAEFGLIVWNWQLCLGYLSIKSTQSYREKYPMD